MLNLLRESRIFSEEDQCPVGAIVW